MHTNVHFNVYIRVNVSADKYVRTYIKGTNNFGFMIIGDLFYGFCDRRNCFLPNANFQIMTTFMNKFSATVYVN